MKTKKEKLEKLSQARKEFRYYHKYTWGADLDKQEHVSLDSLTSDQLQLVLSLISAASSVSYHKTVEDERGLKRRVMRADLLKDSALVTTQVGHLTLIERKAV